MSKKIIFDFISNDLSGNHETLLIFVVVIDMETYNINGFIRRVTEIGEF